MLYENFFSLLSVFIGLSGSIFLVKSVLILNPRAILKLTSPYSRIAYAPEQIKSFAKQKADALVGVLLVFIAFLIQIHSLIFVSNENYLLQSKIYSILIVIGMTILLTFIFVLINLRIYRKNKFEIDKIVINDFCIQRIDRLLEQSNLNLLERMAAELLDFKKIANESRTTFFVRLFKYVGWTIPNDLEIEQINEN